MFIKSEVCLYVVTKGTYSDYGFVGLFSTRKLAEAYITKAMASEECYDEFNDVEVWLLDAEVSACEYTDHFVGIMLDTGEVKEEPNSHTSFGVPQSSHYVATKVPIYNGRGIVRARSHKSAEHALKVAVEARQKWLRTH